MEVEIPGASYGVALLWAVVFGMWIGIAVTAFRLDQRQWRKWWNGYWIRPNTIQSPLLLVVAISCGIQPFLNGPSWPLSILGVLSLLGFWMNLDSTVCAHLQKEEERRQSEISHWRNRKPAEEWLARQSLLKRRELKEVQADSLRHLMDPHFLFNALNGVMHDFLKGEPKQALSNLGAFKRLAVQQIQTSHGGWWSLEDEWRVLEDYLQLELRRLERPLDWRLAPLSAHIKSRTIPAFLVQPLVENALWHGLGGTAESGAGQLTIAAQMCGADHAEISVTNSATTTMQLTPHQEIGGPNRRRHATDLIRQRLRLLDGHGPSKLDIKKEESHTCARLIVPCRNKMLRTY